MLALWKKFVAMEDRGASMVEYALLVVLIAIVAIVAISLAGDEVSSTGSASMPSARRCRGSFPSILR